jgi:hypothetical protein
MRPRSPPLTTEHSTGRFTSPGSVRHRFVREQVNVIDAHPKAQWSSPQSPNARFGSRDDAPHRHSPDSRRYSDNHRSWARNASSPNTPRERPAQRPEVLFAERNRSVGGTIDFDGLRDVPTGPRCSISAPKAPKWDGVTRAPYIFISLRYIPNLPNLKGHLKGMLGKLRPNTIDIDEYGWNLVYEDSPAGLEKLTRCFERFNMKLFFSEYELRMLCYPNGKQPQPQQDMDILSSGGFNDSGALHTPQQRPDNTATPKFAGFEGRQITYPEPIRSLDTKIDTMPSKSGADDVFARTPNRALPDNLFGHLSDVLQNHEAPPTGTNTSLLSLRSDRDETGSLASGVTRSDSSRVKRNRCHRCKGEAVPGGSTLVRCSICPRQYHRRCHQDPAIPLHLADSHDWRCAPCVKKGKFTKEPPKEDTSKSPSKPEEPVPNTNSVPKRAPDEQPSLQPTDRGPMAMNVGGVSNEQLQLLRSDSKSPQNEIERSSDLTTKMKPGTADEHATLSDADDLVAKSFAAIENQAQSKARSQKPGKLKITRTKLPPKTPSKTIRQSQSEAQSGQNDSSTANAFAEITSEFGTKEVSTNEVITRNSVADLRALAHERHQTAVKNGADGHFVSEEQRFHRNTPDEIVRSSAVHQSLSEAQVPQSLSAMKTRTIAPAVAKHVVEREIPESPDEVRRSESSSNPTSAPRALTKLPIDIAFVPPRRTSIMRPKRDEKSPALMRPRAPSTLVHCETCQKKIPPGPTGKNKLCSGCKRDAAAASGPEGLADAKSTPQAPVTPLHASVAPVANMGTGPEVVIATTILGPPSAEVIGNDQEEQGASVADDKIVRLACDTCRKRHTRCTHNELINRAPTLPQVNQQVDVTANFDEANPLMTGGDMDDNARASQAKHAVPDEDVMRNPLVADVLGELQFAPTVQMLLREEPTIEETKMRQMKQILDKNPIAQTDMSILATELVEAERLRVIEREVGHSFKRPLGARLKLVAMALGSTASRRMQAKDIMEWIATTIPKYTKGKGTWESRITSELSQDKLVASGSGYWREEEWQDGDDGKPKAKWYRLLPEKEDQMWTWCPVLKQPLAPSAPRKTGKVPLQHVPAPGRASTAASTPVPATPRSSMNETVSIYCGSFVQGENGERLDTVDAEAAGDVTMETDSHTIKDPQQSQRGKKRKHQAPNMANLYTPEKNDASSSDDEPLSAATKRRRAETLSQDRTKLQAVSQNTPANREPMGQSAPEPRMSTSNHAEGNPHIPEVSASVSRADLTSLEERKSALVTLYLNGGRKPSIAGALDHYIPAKREQLVTSLYDEWPEFRQHASDEHDKLAEIGRRPRKKQFFGRPASRTYVRPHKDSFDQATISCNYSPEKRTRVTMADPRPDEPYPWENPDVDPTRKEYTSLEEFFDFPNNIIPIISEGQLAYRDGTKTDDGRLPRAREIFKP